MCVNDVCVCCWAYVVHENECLGYKVIDLLFGNCGLGLTLTPKMNKVYFIEYIT